MKKNGKTMNKTKRLAEIKRMVEQQGRIEVNDLSEIFGVSEVTIRKDLDVLEERRCLKRIYGAALPVKEVTELSSVQEEYLGMHIEYDSRKEEIGRLAASLVTDTGWLFIGQGTTCYYVARELAKFGKVNVLTNNLLAAQALAKNTEANVILTGGNLVHSHLYGSRGRGFVGRLYGELFDRTYCIPHYQGDRRQDGYCSRFLQV